MERYYVDCWLNVELIASYEFPAGSAPNSLVDPPIIDAPWLIERAKENLSKEGRAAAPFSDVRFNIRRQVV
jgi:hypothetical protein